jgi:hypothetical protein
LQGIMSEHSPFLPAGPERDAGTPADPGSEVSHGVTGSSQEIPPGLTYQLRFDQFKQITTLSVASVGGVLVLLQAGYLQAGGRSWAVVAAFALSAALSLFGQDKLVEGLEAGAGRTPAAKAFLLLALALMGAGIGMLIQLVV